MWREKPMRTFVRVVPKGIPPTRIKVPCLLSTAFYRFKVMQGLLLFLQINVLQKNFKKK